MARLSFRNPKNPMADFLAPWSLGVAHGVGASSEKGALGVSGYLGAVTSSYTASWPSRVRWWRVMGKTMPVGATSQRVFSERMRSGAFQWSLRRLGSFWMRGSWV